MRIEIGKAVFEQVNKMGKKFTAVTGKETLDFFLKSGFVLKKTIKNYWKSIGFRISSFRFW
jgi:hypothetical protein